MGDLFDDQRLLRPSTRAELEDYQRLLAQAIARADELRTQVIRYHRQLCEERKRSERLRRALARKRRGGPRSAVQLDLWSCDENMPR
ncbi:MAG: hypothetical protein H6707_20725 [Deltaproteobacteria bacterium]|nr:hypothetical protein [Deltaproteobacteria bacterium]